MDKFLKAVAIGFIVVLLVACGKEKDRLYTIGIVQITSDPVLDEARKGVIASLEEEGFIEGKNITIDYKNAQGDISNIPLILRKFISDKVDMVITNSTPCMVAAAQAITEIPVVFTVAFSPEQLKMKEVPPNLTGVYDPLYMDDFVHLMKSIVSGLNVVGLPYNPAEPNACLAAENLRQELKKQGIKLIEMPVYASSDVLQVAEALADKGVDAFAVSADNTVYVAFDSVAKIAGERHIPLFVTEPSQVKRGACAGVGPDFYQWGRESGRVCALIIKGEKADQIPICPIKNKAIYLNMKSAKTQGVSFPPDLIKDAYKVIR
jgi:putative ABC transport system substrate-binding protein